MTGPVKVFVDSTAGISPELAREWNVGVIPLNLIWEDRTYRDGVDLLPAEFYRQLARSASNPKTSAPSPADFAAAIQAALADGYRQILIITVTPTMSATYSHACLAMEEFESGTVGVLDSGQGAGGQALTAALSARVAKQGACLPEVKAAGEAASQRTEVFMAVDTLRYLRRSGRISLARAVLGEMIQMKPILTFKDHRLTVIAKPRTMRSATEWLLDRLLNSGRVAEQVLVMYADTPDAAERLAVRIRQQSPEIELDTSPVSAVVGGNTGPGLLGIAVRWQRS